VAISLKASQGAWTTVSGAPSLSLSGSPVSGDRYYAFILWKNKDAIITTTSSSAAWTNVVTFTDGAVVSGNGTGSVTVSVWYKDWVSGDPTTVSWNVRNLTDTGNLTFGVGGTTWQLWQKDGSETWDTPTGVSAAWPSSSNQTISSSSSAVVPNSSVVMGVLGVADDSATFTRSATSIGGTGITFNGDYVEAPATHLTTTTGNDMAADLGHRFVTTGATAALTQTATLSAAETGSAAWAVQGVSGGAPPASFVPPVRGPHYDSLIQL
jgi:hypothetical protein